jgi:starch phosphorylase
LDGANIEIRDCVGHDNFFLFGLKTDEVFALKDKGYKPRTYYENDAELKTIIDRIAAGDFANGDKELFQTIVESLLEHDEYLLLADYRSYLECQEAATAVYRDKEKWIRMSILNTARCGFFSSDRSMRQYCEDIWKVTPIPVVKD